MPKVDPKTMALDQPEGVLRRRRRVRPEEHHLGGRARPRGRAVDRQDVLAARTSTERPLPDGGDLIQKMGIHEWSYDNDISQRQALPGAASRQGRGAEGHQGRGRARLRPSSSRSEEAQRCLNCDVQTVFTAQLCIECDACVDICPMDCITFTANGEEAELRTRLQAPAHEPRPRTSTSSDDAQDRPRHGEGRGRLPALRAVRRALPDRRLGHAEVSHRNDSRG